MGFKFRKSFKIAPGVKLNLNKNLLVLHSMEKELISQLIVKEKLQHLLVYLGQAFIIKKQIQSDIKENIQNIKVIILYVQLLKLKIQNSRLSMKKLQLK